MTTGKAEGHSSTADASGKVVGGPGPDSSFDAKANRIKEMIAKEKLKLEPELVTEEVPAQKVDVPAVNAATAALWAWLPPPDAVSLDDHHVAAMQHATTTHPNQHGMVETASSYNGYEVDPPLVDPGVIELAVRRRSLSYPPCFSSAPLVCPSACCLVLTAPRDFLNSAEEGAPAYRSNDGSLHCCRKVLCRGAPSEKAAPPHPTWGLRLPIVQQAPLHIHPRLLPGLRPPGKGDSRTRHGNTVHPPRASRLPDCLDQPRAQLSRHQHPPRDGPRLIRGRRRPRRDPPAPAVPRPLPSSPASAIFHRDAFNRCTRALTGARDEACQAIPEFWPCWAPGQGRRCGPKSGAIISFSTRQIW